MEKLPFPLSRISWVRDLLGYLLLVVRSCALGIVGNIPGLLVRGGKLL
jgi:hypothetical protein